VVRWESGGSAGDLAGSSETEGFVARLLVSSAGAGQPASSRIGRSWPAGDERGKLHRISPWV